MYRRYIICLYIYMYVELCSTYIYMCQRHKLYIVYLHDTRVHSIPKGIIMIIIFRLFVLFKLRVNKHRIINYYGNGIYNMYRRYINCLYIYVYIYVCITLYYIHIYVPKAQTVYSVSTRYTCS
jgi:hypothetical protein